MQQEILSSASLFKNLRKAIEAGVAKNKNIKPYYGFKFVIG
jgi:hypothetical protein